MANIQLHLIFKFPDFYTDESIIKQFNDFIQLGFFPELQQLMNKNQTLIKKELNDSPPIFLGTEFLNFLFNILTITETQPVNLSTSILRVRYAEFQHYFRVNEANKKEVLNLLKTTVETAKISGNSHEIEQSLTLLNNVSKRFKHFQEKMYLLFNEQLALYAQFIQAEAKQHQDYSIQEMDFIQDIYQKNYPSENKLSILKAIKDIKEHQSHIINSRAFIERLPIKNSNPAYIHEQNLQLILETNKSITIQHHHITEMIELSNQYLRDLESQLEIMNTQSICIPVKHIDEALPDVPINSEPPSITETSIINDSLAAPSNHNIEKTPTPKEPEKIIDTGINETSTKQLEPNPSPQKARLDQALHLIENYKNQLLKEQKNFSYRINFFHKGTKQAKISYCNHLIQELNIQKLHMNADTNINQLILRSHQTSLQQIKNPHAVTEGGSYFGTSRMLAIQRLLGIDEAWKKGKSCFLFYKTQSDFHGLKTLGITDERKQKSTVFSFFNAPNAKNRQEYQQLCNKVLP